MKFIFDFDDVLFYNTALLKKHMYEALENAGVPYEKANKFYKESREKGFSMKKFIYELIEKENIKTSKRNLYKKIMDASSDFAILETINLVKKLGKKNCYIVTEGDKSYQLDKIKRVGIRKLFSKIIVAHISKKKIVENICAKHKNEKVIFVDDKIKHFEELDMKKCPNLKTILFDENGLKKLKAEINLSN